jgi:hypothetical protein
MIKQVAVVVATGKVHSADISNPTGYVANPRNPNTKHAIAIGTDSPGCSVS